MWSPPDPYAIPSKNEIQKVDADILRLEAELLEARRRVATLESDIFARRAWIAPIRRLPHEVLSLVFFELVIDDWKAPLRLQNVCRLWRNILLDTPAAWSSITIYDHEDANPDLVAIFFKRSRNASMHLRLFRPFVPSILEQVMHSKERITCLHTYLWAIDTLMSGDINFSELKMLSLFWDGVYEAKGHQFDMMHLFPNLRSLVLNGDQAVRVIASRANLPAIQDLNINCDDSSLLIPILKKCAGSVEKIILSCYSYQKSEYMEDEGIAFPMLQFLQIRNRWSPHVCTQPLFSGSTPALQCYITDGTSAVASFDPGNIRYLQVLDIPNLSLYPHLHSLALRFFYEVKEIMKQLKQEPTTCPGLAFIICTRLDEEEEEDVRWEEQKAMLRDRAKITGKPIKLLGRKAEDDPEFRKHFLNSKIYTSLEDGFLTFTRLPAHSCRVF